MMRNRPALNPTLIWGLIVFGWHALRLWEGRDSSDIRHALRKAAERATRATPKLSCNAAVVGSCLLQRLAMMAMSLMLVVGCSGGIEQMDLGGDDGKKIASLVEELNEIKHSAKKMVDCFASKQAVPDTKKFNQLAFYIVGKPNVTGSTATCKVLVEKAAAGTPIGEQEWTFEKVADGWKIKSAPVP